MGEAQTSGEHQASPNLQTACPRGSGNNDKALASVSPKPGCTPGSCVRCWLRLQRSVLSFCFSNSCLHQHHPATCSFVVTLVLLAWHSQGCIHMFIQGGNTDTGEDSGCFSTSDTNSRNWGNFPPPLLNQCRGSAIIPTEASPRAGNRDCHHPKTSWDSISQRHRSAEGLQGHPTWIQSCTCTNGVRWAQPSALPGLFPEIPRLYSLLLNLCPYR